MVERGQFQGFGVAVAVWLSVATVAIAGPPETTVAGWPQFLGPQRNGISAETDLLET